MAVSPALINYCSGAPLPHVRFRNVSPLVFAQHTMLAGYARSAGIKQKTEALAGAGKLTRSLKNDIRVGRLDGSFGTNLVLDTKIGLTLTVWVKKLRFHLRIDGKKK